MTQIFDLEEKRIYEIQAGKEGENKITCPKCSYSRKNKRDRCLQWNEAKGIGQCYHCGTAFIKYDPFRNKHPEKNYAVPEWKNNTSLTDKAVSYFTGRMISQSTLNKMKVYSDKEWMPQYQGEVPVICFPYFRNGQLVNIKYRGPQKSFKMVSNAELVFFNLDCLKEAHNVIIVEGEIDALSFIEVGYENVISVPNGAAGRDMQYLDNCIEALLSLETIYIATDQDEPGISLRYELLRRLDRDKCRIVDFRDCKDANEMLCRHGGLALKACIESAIELPIPGIFELRSHYDEIRLLFENGLQKGSGIGIPEVDEGLNWKTGQLVVWTGLTSHGKSEMLNFFTVKWNVYNGWKCAFFSPENMPYQRHLYPKLASVILGCEFKKGSISDQEFEDCFDYIDDNFKFIDAGDDYTVETVMNAAKMMVKRYGIKVLVIDPYNCFEHRQRKGESETIYIGRFLDELVRFAKKYDVLVNLVAHPPKLAKLNGKREKPDLYDINGSANFANKADIGITVYRRYPENGDMPGTELIKRKIRFKEQGTVGSVDMFYNLRNGRYDTVSDITLKDNSNWLSAKKTCADTKAIKPNMAFEDNDDCPF